MSFWNSMDSFIWYSFRDTWLALVMTISAYAGSTDVPIFPVVTLLCCFSPSSGGMAVLFH
jgi:hypothetical protein